MKTEDIDKRIGMPDVDAEWEKFEREVIGKEIASSRKAAAAWLWGLSIAASVALVAGIFLYGHHAEEPQLLANQEKEPSIPTQQSPSPSPQEESPASVLDGFPVKSSPSTPPATSRQPSTKLLAKAKPSQPSTTTSSTTVAPENVYDCGEEMPFYPGGEQALQELIKNNLRYPELAKKYGANGRIFMTFLIDTLGQPTDIRAFRSRIKHDTTLLGQESEERQNQLKEEITRQLNEEAIRVLSLMQKWTPGNQYGRLVPVRFTVPVSFTVPKPEVLMAKEQTDESSNESLDITPIDDALQRRIAGLNIVPSSVVKVPENVKRKDSVLTVPSTPVAQLSAGELKARRMAYLLNSYRKGFVKDGSKKYFMPDLFDTSDEERLFGPLAQQYGRTRQENFGLVGSDARGIYVPLIREAVIIVKDETWMDEHGQLMRMDDDPRVNAVVNELKKAAAHADASIERGDSIVRIAFIYGGKVTEGATHTTNERLLRMYQIVEGSIFYFTPDADAASFWWGEACFKTTPQRRVVVHLHSVDKLYATDCPDILDHRRHVEGTVLDENGKPMSDALVTNGTVLATEACGVRTDSTGHFDFWLPYSDATISVLRPGYQTVSKILSTDTALTIRMKDATRLKDVIVRTRKNNTGNQDTTGIPVKGIDITTFQR